MALTTQRLLALFDALEALYSPVLGNMAYASGLSSQPHSMLDNEARATQKMIMDHLTNYVYPFSDIQTVLESHIDDWLSLGFETIEIQNGSSGNIGGLNYSSNNDRAEIKRKILGIVPYGRDFRELLRRKQFGGSTIDILT